MVETAKELYSLPIENLKRVINGRTIAILQPGSSLKELRDKIDKFADFNFCYVAHNDFWTMEEKILSKINKKLDIIMCSAPELNVPDKHHIEFLDRIQDNLFITEECSVHRDLQQFKEKYGDKLFFFHANRSPRALRYPDRENPLDFLAQASFSVLLCLGVIGGARQIILFGADGGKIGDDLYYPELGWRWNWDNDPLISEARTNADTVVFNKTMPTIVSNVYRLYDVPFVPILNCSLVSKYTVFPKVSYEEVINGLIS